ncbi:MAG: D-alanine--D-alanine ligase [Halobacteriovoraceae bacterium]|nr:D-alanine--D-alanine ligase [Halobacteriovoraceae bacterium]
MANTINVLLICGGGSTEHEVSLISAKFILEQLQKIEGVTPHYLCIEKDGRRTNLKGDDCELRKAGEIFNRVTDELITLNYAIPCIHGPPGENGQIQAVFEMMGLPFLGAGSEASISCFNKITTKLWLESFDIPTTPFVGLSQFTDKEILKAEKFFQGCGNDVFVKATNQGSSVGCYHITNQTELREMINEAFNYSPFVLVEKTLKGRELEVAVFENNEETIASVPGEIICPSGFYDYEEKYSNNSQTKTLSLAPDIPTEKVELLKEYAIKAFEGLKIKDLARVDFFLTEDGDIFLNEINTFPGHTPISMFPSMMKEAGLDYEQFLRDRLKAART